MIGSFRVLVCGASPDSVNNNSVLRGYVANGFRAHVPEGAVRVCSLEGAERVARDFHPHLIIVFGSCMPAVANYLGVKAAALDVGACLAFWLHDDPYEFDYAYKIVPLADVVFSNDRWTATHYSHPHVFHVPLAADRAAHFRDHNPTKERDVFFCGVGFPNRIALLRDCVDSLRPFNVVVAGAEWPSDLPFAENRRVPNADLPDLHASSLLTLNMGRRFNLANSRFNLDASTPGPRTFEAAAAGTVQCMFVEGLEIDDYFSERAGEILLFDSPRELRTHIEMLRDDPARAAAIAFAAQRRAMKDHTYENRAARILEAISDLRP
ncbi:glycosyltransferase [Paraburkholderia sp. RL18-103-BIB-C]|uniref:CgeB family protein n=1 Tax=Paraburkholderia sp. RL18-103-BIB-C TaxID=3031637 RepID=UPI0038B9BE9A